MVAFIQLWPNPPKVVLKPHKCWLTLKKTSFWKVRWLRLSKMRWRGGRWDLLIQFITGAETLLGTRGVKHFANLPISCTRFHTVNTLKLITARTSLMAGFSIGTAIVMLTKKRKHGRFGLYGVPGLPIDAGKPRTMPTATLHRGDFKTVLNLQTCLVFCTGINTTVIISAYFARFNRQFPWLIYCGRSQKIKRLIRKL